MGWYYLTYDITTGDDDTIDSFSLSWTDSSESEATEESKIQILRYMYDDDGDYGGDLYYTLLAGDITADPSVTSTYYLLGIDSQVSSIEYTAGELAALEKAYKIEEWDVTAKEAMQELTNYALSSSIKVGNLMNFKKVKATGVARSSVSTFISSEVASSGISIAAKIVTTVASDDESY